MGKRGYFGNGEAKRDNNEWVEEEARKERFKNGSGRETGEDRAYGKGFKTIGDKRRC